MSSCLPASTTDTVRLQNIAYAASMETYVWMYLQVTAAIDEALEWLDDNQDAEEDDYREKQKDVEDICSPIVGAAYQAGGGPAGDDDDLEDHDEL